MKIKQLPILLLVFLVYGCAPWQLVERPREWKYLEFEATLPVEWMKFNSCPDLLFLTKDGESLQNIRIFRYQISKKETLPITKKVFVDTMLPQEISELIVDEMSLDQNRQKLKIIENIPVDISGEKGFKVEYTFNTPDKLKLKSILYGFKKDNFIYLIQYQAAEQYYFGKDLAVFNNFINNFKILK